MPSHPFGILPLSSEVARAVEATHDVYKPLPETICDHRALCCRAGCPNMYYSEFLSIYQNFVSPMPSAEHVEVTLQCLRMYLQPQSVDAPKPCVFLKENKCSVYTSRPLKCRLYGLYPEPLYRRMVEGVAKDMKVSEERIPLCMQCDRVKIKPEYAKSFPSGKVPRLMIEAMELALRGNDARLGVPKKIQDSGFGYLTYHDWHIMYELGESFMEYLSQVRINWADEKKELLVQDLKKLLSQTVEAIEKDPE